MIPETESVKDVFMYRMEECSSIRLTGFDGEGRRGRGARESEDCLFCWVDAMARVLVHDRVYARFDRYPVSRGHLLIITKRHFADYFEATREEKIAILDVVDRAKQFLDSGYHPDGYNIGVNVGKVAGQAVMHLHIHVIPRYKGDGQNLGGGMRRVIPGSGEGGE